MAVIDDYPAKLTTGYYRVRESWEDTASQVGAFRILANAIAKCDDNPGTYVFDNDGNAIYPEEETEEGTSVEEESGVEDDTETGDDTEVEEDTETGEEDTADGDTAYDDTDDGSTEDDGVAAVSEDTDGEGAADSDAEDSNATDSETEDETSDDTEDSAEEDATDGETGGESTDEVDADETDTEDASDEEFPAAEQDPVAYGRLKTLMNIRVEPSLDAEILTTYAKGTIVSILEILDTGWLKIICDAADDGYAYVSNEEGEYAYVGTSLYTVKSGDTLWKIAQEQLGSGTLYKEIRTLNGLTSNTIKVGMQLILP